MLWHLLMPKYLSKLKDRKMIGRKMLYFFVIHFSVIVVLACPGWDNLPLHHKLQKIKINFK
jgi:hypothetical protein